MRKPFLLLLMLLPALTYAQGDVEYRMEIGGGLGMLTYEGDFNGSILKSGQPMAAAVLRRNINPYHGFRLHLGVGKLKGSSKNAETYYPGMAEAKLCEVEIIDEEFSMKADMKWLDNINENTATAAEVIESFKIYWEGKMTNSPIVEILFVGKYKLNSIFTFN